MEKTTPRTFEAAGHKWRLDINAWTIKRVKQETGVDIGKWTGKDAVDQMIALFSEVGTFVDVLFVLCEEQAKDRGVTDEKFGRGMAGDSIEQAAESFWGAFADFCRSQGREMLLKLLTKAKTLGEKATALAMTEIDNLDVETMLRKQLETSRASSSNSPASSASTPAG